MDADVERVSLVSLVSLVEVQLYLSRPERCLHRK